MDSKLVITSAGYLGQQQMSRTPAAPGHWWGEPWASPRIVQNIGNGRHACCINMSRPRCAHFRNSNKINKIPSCVLACAQCSHCSHTQVVATGKLLKYYLLSLYKKLCLDHYYSRPGRYTRYYSNPFRV